MSINVPDYELADRVVASSARQLKALADPLRSALLDLALERAATVKELAVAVGRPKSTVAHHVGVLVEAGLLRVVRTRRVKAIDERWYGRTGRRIDIKPGSSEMGAATNMLTDAAQEAEPAAERDELRATVRHVRVPDEVIAEFWERALAIADDLTRQARGGDQVHDFVVATFPTDQPTLPAPTTEHNDDRPG